MSTAIIMCPTEVSTELVFAYGSLIWSPEFDFEYAQRATLRGYHRAFCIRSTRHRGTPVRPGVVLGLDRGGSCVGLVYRLRADTRAQALSSLFAREVPSAAERVYQPRIVRVCLDCGTPVQALAFIADRGSTSYARLSDEEVVQRLACCEGARGPNRDYAINTWRALEARGFVDKRLRRIARLLEATGLPS
jgi:cation transport protein ChaC